MATSFPPVPPGTDINSIEYQNWLEQLRQTIGGTSIPFNNLDFTGSNMTSIVTRDHNDLTTKQGGATNEFYHLSQSQHTDLTDGGDSTSHYHASDRSRANHTGTQTLSTISDAGTAAAQDYSSGTWTPSFTNLTVVLGGGSVAYTGRWIRVGNLVKFNIKITPSGGATTSSTAGSTYSNLGVAVGYDDTDVAASATSLLGLGTGYVDSTNDRVYPPGWVASSDVIIISGTYEV